MRWGERIERELAEIRRANRWRETRAFDALGQSGALEGTAMVSFGGNDYLGLSQHPQVIEAAVAAARRWGTGSTSARLLVGTRPVHHDLESALAEWKEVEAATVFSTGYQANVGVLSTLVGPDVTVLSDELNHASIIDGCRMARGEVRVFSHGDLDEVETLLGDASGPTVVVTDTVFSMDGDAADLGGLVEVCTRHDALLVLDEAHAVLGPELEVHDAGCEIVRVGTLSKTLGALGGFVCGSRSVVDLLVNRARPYIFTTALTPHDAAAALAALNVLRSAEGTELLARLRHNIDRVRPGQPSPIVPIIVGEEERAAMISAALAHRGLFVPAVRPPTVPPGSSRLRVALSAAHTDTQIDQLVEALRDLGVDP